MSFRLTVERKTVFFSLAEQASFGKQEPRRGARRIAAARESFEGQVSATQPLVEAALMDTGFDLVPLHQRLPAVGLWKTGFMYRGQAVERAPSPAMVGFRTQAGAAVNVAFDQVPSVKDLERLSERLQAPPVAAPPPSMVSATGPSVQGSAKDAVHDPRFAERTREQLERAVQVAEATLAEDALGTWDEGLPHYVQYCGDYKTLTGSYLGRPHAVEGPAQLSLSLQGEWDWLELRVAFAALPEQKRMKERREALIAALKSAWYGDRFR